MEGKCEGQTTRAMKIRCLLKLGFVEGDEKSTWDLRDDAPLVSSAFFSSEDSCLGLEPAFRYLKQVAEPRLTGIGLGNGGRRMCAML